MSSINTINVYTDRVPDLVPDPYLAAFTASRGGAVHLVIPGDTQTLCGKAVSRFTPHVKLFTVKCAACVRLMEAACHTCGGPVSVGEDMLIPEHLEWHVTKWGMNPTRKRCRGGSTPYRSPLMEGVNV